MTIITTALLRSAMPFARTRDIAAYAAPLDASAQRYDITTPRRIEHWLAEIAHESGSLRYVREIASGEAYEGRRDLGNTQPGDGVRYKGRGLIQVTGRANYAACGAALGLDLIAQPKLLEHPDHATASAGWFWDCHGLNALADADNLDAIADIINRGRKTAAYGDANGFADRKACLDRARLALAASPTIA